MAMEQELSNITAIMQMMLEMKTQDRQAEQRRIEREETRMEEMRVAEQKRIEREEIRQEEQLKREECKLIALRAAQPVVPQTVTMQNHTLPKITEQEEIETFVAV